MFEPAKPENLGASPLAGLAVQTSGSAGAESCTREPLQNNEKGGKVQLEEQSKTPDRGKTACYDREDDP